MDNDECSPTLPMYWLSVPVYSSWRKNCFHIQPLLERLRVSKSLLSCVTFASSTPTVPFKSAMVSTLWAAHIHKRHTVQLLILSDLNVARSCLWFYLPRLKRCLVGASATLIVLSAGSWWWAHSTCKDRGIESLTGWKLRIELANS